MLTSARLRLRLRSPGGVTAGRVATGERDTLVIQAGGGQLIDDVAAVLREAAQTAILPLYQRLTTGDVEEKGPGDLVTVADRRAEQIIGAGLTGLLPGSTMVGEEGVAEDPALLERLGDAGPVWLVDPLDGTANFVAGVGPFVVMVALLYGGVARSSWILDLVTGKLAVAESGSGAYLDGVRINTKPGSPILSALRGNMRSQYLPTRIRSSVRNRAANFATVLPGTGCAGREYLDLVAGQQDFVLFWRTLPWDHAPGVLFAHEAGGVARRLDGGRYLPTDPRPGLLVARNDDVWHQVHTALLEPEAGFPYKSVG